MRKLWRLGFQASVDEVMTSGAALQFVLADRGERGAAFVIGSQALVDHVADAGMRIVNNTEFATRADIVVVAGHDGFDFRELRIATQAVLRGAELIGVTRDRTFPMPDGPWPGSGAMLAAVEEATGQRAERTVGKPEPDMYAAARDRLGDGRYLAVGDRLDTDVEGARRAGIDSALVLTGATSQAEARRRRAAADAGGGLAVRARCWADRLPSPARMDRRFCLIVNPSAGRGRAARLLPRVEQALRARGLAFRVERTDSLAHARELARGALAAGEVAAAMGGDGLLGAVAGELRGSGGLLGVLPGGRGNDFARKLGIGTDPEQACDVLAAGRRRLIDVAEAGGRSYLGIASAGFDSDVQDIANGTRLPLGELVYVYATLRALHGWRHARWEVVVDGEAQEFDGYSVAVANSGVFGGGMYLVPDASLDDGMLDVVLTRAACKWSYLAERAQGVQGHARRQPGPDVPARPRDQLPRRSPVRRICRRRPDRRPARHHQGRAARARGAGPLMLLGPKVAAAKAVGTVVRAARRGGGTSLPGKLLTRLEPHAIGLLAQRLEHGSAVISATNGKTTTAAMAASILERSGETLVHNRAGANMAGGVASALASAARRGGRELDGELGLFEVDEFWLGPVVAELEAARAAAGQPVPRPARPLRRARDHRRPLGRGGRRARGRGAGAERRRPAGRRPRP